jgi:hypothetical protein
MTEEKRLGMWVVRRDEVGFEWVVFGINGVLALLYGVFQRLITTRPRMQVSHPFLVIACVVSRAPCSARGSYTPKVCGLRVSRDNQGVCSCSIISRLSIISSGRRRSLANTTLVPPEICFALGGLWFDSWLS